MSDSTYHSGHALSHDSHGHHGRDHDGHGIHQEGHDHGGHRAPDRHTHGGHAAKVTWWMAASATLHCLTGCAIGEVLGMVVGTALGWGNAPTVILSVALAFLFGYALTLLSLRRAGVGWREAVRLALAADTLSILVMEIVDNGVMVALPGAMDAELTSGLFWSALALALLLAFLVTTPVNKWIIGRGGGHAVVHAYHR
ncbi:DUF4396 domain-containing protein [Sphaerimonospora thailandensis]|uniref:DUF4396 domain-containing protein n=1 Tax=Sphaerimonospora thailandensis TaxID=795644 RepID=A0A8J3R8F2_9ACTN|nr:DUF4396 domain-containing protein [Sphaerimonospora thailandensis]GIH70388.1 hypothetical protein Mth01_26410 [Sphaerimonospora thailandensis]